MPEDPIEEYLRGRGGGGGAGGGNIEDEDIYMVLPDGTAVLKDGTRIRPDGTRINPDGTVASGPTGTPATGRTAGGGGGGTAPEPPTQRQSFEESRTTRVNRQWVDVPTPEQFLDDFKNGVAAYFKNIRKAGGFGQTGGIGVNEMMWLMDNVDILFNEYLGELGQMAQRGEAVFRPVNLGTYPGDTSTTVSTSRSGQVPLPAGGAAPPSGAQPGGTAGGGTAGAGGGAGGAVPSAAGAGQPAPTSQFIPGTESVSTGVSTSEGTDVIAARPAPGYVHTLAPLDFLSKQFPASSLRILFEGRRGMRRANERVGGATSARRIG